MRFSRGRSLSTSGSSSVATARLDKAVMAGAAGRRPHVPRATRPCPTPAILSLKYATPVSESGYLEPESEHPELKTCRFRHHRRIPDRIPDHLDLGPGNPGHALDPVLHLSRQSAGDWAAGGGQGHLDLHPPAGLDVEVVDQSHLVDVDRDLRVVDRLQRLDDAVLDARLGAARLGGGRRSVLQRSALPRCALQRCVRFCCHDVSFQLRQLRPAVALSAASADCRACQARVAHLTRIGYSPTPAKAASLPSSSAPPPAVSVPPRVEPPPSGAPVTRAWKRSKRRRVSSSDLPRSASVIIEAEAVEMAQPTPSKAISSIRPCSTRR